MMRRIFHYRFIFMLLILMHAGGFSMNAWGGTKDALDPKPTEPHSCQEIIVELQNQLHAANQNIELWRDENRSLHSIIKRAESRIRELQNTIQRIRNNVGDERIRPSQKN